MHARRRVRAEVREEEQIGIPREDAIGARAPRLEIDVGRRRRRQHQTPARPADAGRIADEREPRRRQEVADVMRRVARRLGRLDRVADDLERSRSLRICSRAAGTARTSPHSRFMSAPYSRDALASSADGSAMCGAPFACTNTRASRAAVDQHARRARVIEMDVRDQNRAHIAKRHALRSQLPLERLQRRRRPGIDERDARVAVQDAGRDDPGLPRKSRST